MRFELKRENIGKGTLICVNADHLLMHQERDLEKLTKDIWLEKKTNRNLQLALKRIDARSKIVAVSGFRSLQEQTDLYQTSLKENGELYTKRFVALPNASEHQSGLAIDLALNSDNIDFICPSFPYYGICQAFRDIAMRFGFIERYTEEKKLITKIAKEEWHFRYVGIPHAEIMKERQLCLEEYIEWIKQFTYPKWYCCKGYKLSYIPYQNENFWIDLKRNQSISGNNIDGFILTEQVYAE